MLFPIMQISWMAVVLLMVTAIIAGSTGANGQDHPDQLRFHEPAPYPHVDLPNLIQALAHHNADPVHPNPDTAHPKHGEKKWCVARPESVGPILQGIMAYICTNNPEYCKAVEPGGDCYVSDIAKAQSTLMAHVSYVMNYYYQSRGGKDKDCQFSGFGMITTVDPSTPTCKYDSP